MTLSDEQRKNCTEYLLGIGYSDVKWFEGDRWAAILPFLYTTGIIYGNLSDISWGYSDRWCYHRATAARTALGAWDGTGEPTGWHRHPDSGRRVDEQGNMYVWR